MPNDEKKRSNQIMRGARAVLRDRGESELPSNLNRVINNSKPKRPQGIMPYGFGVSGRQFKGYSRINKTKRKQGNKPKGAKRGNKMARQVKKDLTNYNLNAVRDISERNRFRQEDNKQTTKGEF